MLPIHYAQVADGNWTRHRVSRKVVYLSSDMNYVMWEEGKKSINLSQVQRITVGVETKTLRRLYENPNTGRHPQPCTAINCKADAVAHPSQWA